MILRQGSTIVFIGDSITAAGRGGAGEAVPWEEDWGLGRGYVAQVWSWLVAAHAGLRCRVVNRGVSGDTVRGLAQRWEADALAESPDVLAVMIGINDVWRQFDQPWKAGAGVGPEEFRDTLGRLAAEARRRVPRLLLATPFVLEPRRTDPFRQRMDEYGGLVRQIAGEVGAECVEVQAAFDRVMEHVHPCALAWDRIHPGPHGHMVIARAFLQALGAL